MYKYVVTSSSTKNKRTIIGNQIITDNRTYTFGVLEDNDPTLHLNVNDFTSGPLIVFEGTEQEAKMLENLIKIIRKEK